MKSYEFTISIHNNASSNEMFELAQNLNTVEPGGIFHASTPTTQAIEIVSSTPHITLLTLMCLLTLLIAWAFIYFAGRMS